MRVTDAQMHRDMGRAIANSLVHLDRYQLQAATGRRFQKASEDPGSTVQGQKLQTMLDQNATYQNNVHDGLHWLAATEAPMASVGELLTQLKETALRGSSDTAEDHNTLAAFVDQLLTEIISHANATDGDRYVFAGFATNTAPYAASSTVTGETFHATLGAEVDLAQTGLERGSVALTNAQGSLTYREGVDYRVDYSTGRIEALVGGALTNATDYRVSYKTTGPNTVTAAAPIAGDIVRQLGPERTEAVNMTGPQVFADGGNVFQIAIDLKNALRRGDMPRTRQLLQSIDDASAHVAAQTGLMGARSAAFESQRIMLETDELALKAHLSQVQDADLPDVMLKLTAQQNAYQAALGATSRMFQMSLANFLQ